MRIAAMPLALILGARERKLPQTPSNSTHVWSVHLRRIHGQVGPDITAHREIRSIAFSPDDRHIAVAVYQHDAGRLIILNVDSPEVKHTDLDAECAADIRWNENGMALLVCGWIVRLSNLRAATRCQAAVPYYANSAP